MVLQRAPAKVVLWGYVPNCQEVNINYPDYSFNATLEKIPGKSTNGIWAEVFRIKFLMLLF